MKIVVVDTETTGLDPAQDTVLEYVAVPLHGADAGEVAYMSAKPYATLLHYSGEVPAVARAVHHISPAALRAARTTLPQALEESGYRGADVVVAHNAEFDRKFLEAAPGGAAGPRWLCTYRCAKHLWPDAPRHTNMVLFYWLGLDADTWLPADLHPHRALFDALVTAALLRHMLLHEGQTIEGLLALQDRPVVQRRVGFGKHRGQPWDEVPNDYLEWLLKKGDLDPEVRHTAEVQRQRRLSR